MNTPATLLIWMTLSIYNHLCGYEQRSEENSNATLINVLSLAFFQKLVPHLVYQTSPDLISPLSCNQILMINLLYLTSIKSERVIHTQSSVELTQGRAVHGTPIRPLNRKTNLTCAIARKSFLNLQGHIKHGNARFHVQFLSTTRQFKVFYMRQKGIKKIYIINSRQRS